LTGRRAGRLALSVWVLVSAARPGAAAVTPAQSCAGADLILLAGRIHTLDDRDTVVQALAVRDGRITAAGATEEVSGCAGPGARRVDLRGRTVLPGLIDVHTHAMEWAKGIVRGEIPTGYPAVRSVGDVVAAVRESARGARAGSWIRSAGWDDSKLAEKRYLTRGDLDPVSPDHPVYLIHVSGHLAVANTVALRLANVTRDTPDPQGGVIERARDGEPTGILKDTAMGLVGRLLPPDPPDLARKAAGLVSERAAEVGLTTLHDVALSPEEMRAYQEADAQGWLKVRVRLVPLVGSVEDAERLAAQGVRTGFGSDRLRLGGVKMFADGGMGARTIAIYEPPVSGEPGNLGLLVWKTEDMRKAHGLLAEAGWQLVTHAIGDRAMDQVLDSYEAVIRERGLKDARFRIVHAGVSTPAVQKRLRALGVGVDGNPPFTYWIGSWFRKYGPDRVRWSYPGRSYVENGIVAGAGSDVPVTPISPWWGIWAGVARKELQTGEVLAPEERLSVRDVLRMYTRNGAWLGFEEGRVGVLAPGAFADLIVVDRDVMTVPADELKDVKVLQTVIAGEVVFESRGGKLAFH
jgi:predicted amidohydrolase YtcJ